MTIKRSETGHRCGESHPKAKKSDVEVEEMRRRCEEEGIGYKRAAKIFECNVHTARNILSYRTRYVV